MHNIELIPAIDIIGGKCVRLTRGDYQQVATYNDDPVDQAKQFEALGFRRLHVVDLDGAKSKHIVNVDVLSAITHSTNLIVDFGGGVKSNDDLDRAFQAGASMVTAGSIAVTNPEEVGKWINHFGADRIILGADAHDGRISINGWKEDSSVSLTDFLHEWVEAGITKVLCTDISRDGTLQGPSTALYRDIMARYPHLQLIASGGVGSIADIAALDQAKVPAVVFGKAWYEGKITAADIQPYINVKER